MDQFKERSASIGMFFGHLFFAGSGKFGTVYVVMNLTGKFLMAMKQIRIERNDKALLALVDEVENLRSLDHPNLVKYYAIEVHRVKDILNTFLNF